MGSRQEWALRILRDNPDGLTTVELADYMEGETDASTKRSKTFQVCNSLLTFGLVTKELVPQAGKHKIAKWRAVDDS